jgi:DNA-binding MarR family transcriptional regulator
MAKTRRGGNEMPRGSLAKEGAQCVCFNLRKAARAVTQLYDEVFRPTGLRATQLSILAVTNRQGPLTVSRLAEATVTDRTTLTRNLQLLETQGLVRITPGSDRREREVRLTARGSKALADAYPLWKEVQGALAKGLGPERLGRLLADLAAAVAVAKSG